MVIKNLTFLDVDLTVNRYFGRIPFVKIFLVTYLDASLVRHRWEEHLAGKRNWGLALWAVLMFQAWLDAHNG